MQKFLIVSVLTASISFGAFANEVPSSKPLVTIRYNQESVDYKNTLARSVAMAKSAKESVFFDVVSVVPVTDNSSNNDKMLKQAESRTLEVVRTIVDSGVDQNRIRTQIQQDNHADVSEVRIFVR